MRAPALLAALLLALPACTRGLTPAETALVAPLLPDLATEDVRITRSPVVGLFPITYDARPRIACREKIAPPIEGRIVASTAGIVLFERLWTAPRWSLPDYAAPLGDHLDLATAMFFAHEMTHVWQWQARDRTGYHPARAFFEQIEIDDPYLFDADAPTPFLDRGFEEQASLVEEYLCCATLDPSGARTGRLHALLSEALPVAPPARFPRPVLIPWADDLDGICD